jgi:hypothetical protein
MLSLSTLEFVLSIVVCGTVRTSKMVLNIHEPFRKFRTTPLFRDYWCTYVVKLTWSTQVESMVAGACVPL